MSEFKPTIADYLRWGYWWLRFRLGGAVCRFAGHDRRYDEEWAGDERHESNPWCARCATDLS